MELTITRQPIAACEPVLATTAEQPIECDVLLPDYCPDIVRVLCCQAAGVVTDAAVRGDRFVVDGMATVTVCYVGEGGVTKRTEYKIPFSKTIELKFEPKSPVYSITIDQGYLNCRATSRRRLDIRGTLVLGIKIQDVREEQAVADAFGMGVQVRPQEVDLTRISGQSIRQFNVTEDLQPPAGKPAVGEIVRCGCRAEVQECRAVAGRAVLKGALFVHILYRPEPDDGRLYTADFELPVSQLLELSGAPEEAPCEVNLTVSSCEITTGEYDGNEQLRLSAQLVASVCFYQSGTASVATDCFSTRFRAEGKQRSVRAMRLLGMANERHTMREMIDLPEGFEELTDLWADASRCYSRMENGVLTVYCHLSVSLLCRVIDVGQDYNELQYDLEIPVPVDGADAMTELSPKVSVQSVNLSPSGQQAQLVCELLVTGPVIGNEEHPVLTEIQVDENEPRTGDPTVGLTIYYASAGENVWDISKRYGALPGQVMADNDLDGDAIREHTALIIPTA